MPLPGFSSELFVINSVKISEQAFSAVAEHIPSQTKEKLLEKLQDNNEVERIARQKNIQFNEVFDYLKDVILETFNRQPIPQLRREEVKLLLNTDVQYLLAKELSCTPEAALNTLLDVEALKDTLEYLRDEGLTNARVTGEARQLLQEILEDNCASQLEIDYNSNNWETIIEKNGEGWLPPESSAAQLLVQSEKIHGEKNPLQALAELIAQHKKVELEASTKDKPENQNVIGPLGLLALRRRLLLIINSLEDQALKELENAAIRMPNSLSIQLLLSIFHLYERGSIKKGLESYINYSQTLEKLLPKNSFDGFEIEEEQERVVGHEPLTFSGKLFESQEGTVGTFEIQCRLDKQQKPQLILRATNIPEWIYRQLEQDIKISKLLTPEKLKPIENHLYERLLNTLFPILKPEELLLKEAVKKLGSDFFQAVALSCKNPIKLEDIPKKWRESLANQLPYSELPATSDPWYKKGVKEIKEIYQKEYGEQNLEIVEGMNVS